MNPEHFSIDRNYLEAINKENPLQYLGNWIHKTDELREKFLAATPFEHVVIDDFLDPEYAEKIYSLFPPDRKDWYIYRNPIEVKYAFDNINSLPTELRNYFYYLATDAVTNLFRHISAIDDLCYDEYLHGGGLHSHPRLGRLNMHLDYEKHPYTCKERRLNVIYFTTKDWDPAWNGANELWDANMTTCVKKTDVKFNRAIIFKTNDISWHGLPDKIICPENTYRNSLAFYYVSPLNNTQKKEYRYKAKFVKRPQDAYDENMEKLYSIRAERRITEEDVKQYMPNWTIDS